MIRVLPLRVAIILFIIFVGYYFNFDKFEFEWTQISGICEEFVTEDGKIYTSECAKGSNLKENLKVESNRYSHITSSNRNYLLWFMV